MYDSKADFYTKPQCELNAAVALRVFGDLANARDGENMVSRHPGDFTLFECGTWDEHTGIYVQHKAMINLGVALEFIDTVADEVSRIQGGS